MIFYQIEPILVFCLFLWVFYLHGAFICHKLQLKSQGINKLFINLSIGFGFVIFILFFMALFQKLTPVIVSVCFLIVPVLYFVDTNENKGLKFDVAIIAKAFINHAWLIFTILYLLLPHSYNLFLPETSSDAIRYHLPYAQFYVENQGLAVNEFLRYPVFSHNMNLVFSLGYLYLGDFQGEVLARMFSLFSFILLVLGLYCLALKSFNKTTAVIAVIILIKAKIFRILMVSGYVDIGLALFLFVSIYFLYLWQQQKNDKWLYLSACTLGIVIGTKYLGLLWLLPLTIWVLLMQKDSKKSLNFFLLAFIIGSPWYIRNIFIAGNPLHPFLQDVFGFWLWSPEDIVQQKQDLLIRHGIDRTFSNFIKLPYLLETHDYFSKFHLGWFMALGIPCLIFSLTMQRFYKYLAIFVILNIGFWFSTSQIDRYLMPTLAFVALFAAYPIGKLISSMLLNKWLSHKYSVAFIATLLLSYGVYHLKYKFDNIYAKKPLPHSNIDWHSINLKQNKFYSFVLELNKRKAKRVYNISDAMFENSFNGQVLGDWFGLASKGKIYKACKTDIEVYNTLLQFDTRYLLVGKQKKWFNKINIILKNSKYAEVILDTNEAILYLFKKN